MKVSNQWSENKQGTDDSTLVTSDRLPDQLKPVRELIDKALRTKPDWGRNELQKIHSFHGF